MVSLERCCVCVVRWNGRIRQWDVSYISVVLRVETTRIPRAELLHASCNDGYHFNMSMNLEAKLHTFHDSY